MSYEFCFWCVASPLVVEYEIELELKWAGRRRRLGKWITTKRYFGDGSSRHWTRNLSGIWMNVKKENQSENECFTTLMTTTQSSCWWWLVLIGFLLKQIYHVCRLIARLLLPFCLFITVHFYYCSLRAPLIEIQLRKYIVMKRLRVSIWYYVDLCDGLLTSYASQSKIGNRTTPTKSNRTE